MVTPYADTGVKGCNAMNLEEVVKLLKVLNEEGLDFHVHTVGKDADFLVFGTDLLTAEHEGFSHNKPADVYFSGKKVN